MSCKRVAKLVCIYFLCLQHSRFCYFILPVVLLFSVFYELYGIFCLVVLSCYILFDYFVLRVIFYLDVSNLVKSKLAFV